MMTRPFRHESTLVVNRLMRGLLPQSMTSSTAHGKRTGFSTTPTNRTDPANCTPRMPQMLGFAGTLPFLAGALVTTIAPDPYLAAKATQLYGASVLSFLGGVHWGIALREPIEKSALMALTSLPARDFFVSVVPSLLAWSAALAPPHPGLSVLASSFAVLFVYDRIRLAPPSSVPTWYLRLRSPLSIAAAGGCAVAWLAVHPDSSTWLATQADIPIETSNSGETTESDLGPTEDESPSEEKKDVQNETSQS